MKLKTLRKTYPVTYSIIFINVALFILETIAGGSTNTRVALNFGVLYIPYLPTQLWRLFASMFLHFGYVHILMNMYSLANIGPIVEKIFGKWKYLLIYIVSGYCGSLLIRLMESLTNNFSYSAGASGAIFGLLGAILAMSVCTRNSFGYSSNMNGIIYSIIFALLPGFFVSGISLTAHFGGLVGGFLVSYMFLKRERD